MHSLARSVPKPLKVPNRARSVPKPPKMPSSVPKPLLIELKEAGLHQPGRYEPLLILRFFKKCLVLHVLFTSL